MVVNLSGEWRMNGRQTNVPRSDWEAKLVLASNKTLHWTETKGANVGATRRGRWKYDGKVFKMRWVAPRVGLVEWEASSAGPTTMNGSYRTPKAGPQPVGWGGTWSATKISK